jgi:hypothetical protein
MAGEKGSSYANSLLLLIFNGTTFTGVAQNATSSPLIQFWLSLHTGDPTAAGTQASNEVAYTGYARVGVNRSTGAGGLTVTTNSVALGSLTSFNPCTAGSATAQWFGIGTASSGAGVLLYAGPITPNIPISAGVTPQLTTSTTISET